MRVRVVLSVICLLILKVVAVEAQEQRIISSNKGEMSSTEDMICIGTLGAEMDLNNFLGKMKLPLFPDVDEDTGTFAIKVLWNEIPAVRETFRGLAREADYIRNRNIDKNDHYKLELISSILNFIQTLSEKVVGEAHLKAMMVDKSLHLSEIKVFILTDQIELLEQLVHQAGEISPVESFIYSDIINSAVEYLSGLNNDNIGDFSLEQYIAQDYKRFEILDLSDVLRSTGQRVYLFQQYQLLQRYPNRITETTARNSVKTEQEMREDGYSEDVIRGLDHARDNLHLAQLLRTRDIDSLATHVPEFAELIDDHIVYIRKGITESKNMSNSEKTNRLELLDALEAKVQVYKDAEQVTYFYLLRLNVYLSMIATPDSNLLSSEDLHSFMLTEEGDNVNFESFRQWVINDDGSDVLKIADIFNLNEQFSIYKYKDEYGGYGPENEKVINDIVRRLGLSLTLDDLKELSLGSENNDLLFMQRLARRLNLNLRDFDMEDLENGFVNFIYLFNHFPERVMIPTRHDLGFMAITRTHNRGVHLLGLNNDFSKFNGMSSFAFLFHDVSHSKTESISHLQTVNDFESELERLPGLFRELMEELYLDFTHEIKTELTVELTITDLDHDDGETDGVIERYRNEQKALLFQLVSRLGHLTELGELELQKTILVLNYLEFASSYRILEEYEDIEFTERSLVNRHTFMRFMVRLYSLYEEEQRLFNTLDSVN